MSRNGRIAFFLPAVRGGGAQRVVVNLVEGITDRGYPVDLVLAEADGVFLRSLPPAVRMVDLGARRLLGSLRPLAEYLRRERPRVLVSSMSHANLVALWAARLAGGITPVVVTEHNTMSQANQHENVVSRNLWPILLRRFYPWASSVVAVSRGAADDLARTSGFPRAQVEVVYNPVITASVMALAREEPGHPLVRAGAAAGHSRGRSSHPAKGFPHPDPGLCAAAEPPAGPPDYSG